MTPLLVLCGPTAAGKSAVALDVAGAIGAEIVSADSMQIYRGLDVGTAKPSRTDRQVVPHHLIDVAEVDESFSAGRFVAVAEAAISAIRARGRPVIVCGGTMLYLRALLRGLVTLPSDPALRAKLESEPTAALRVRLAAVDSDSAARLHPHDRVRILRALEISLQAGEPASRLRSAHGFRELRPDARVVALIPPRETLRARIDERVLHMVAAGLVEETRGLLRRAETAMAPLPPLRALGYRQIAEHLAGRGTLADAVLATQRATRVFARRQCAWIRKEPAARVTASAGEARALLLGVRAEAA